MPYQRRISFTLSDTNYGDQEIIDFIKRFDSGKGNYERAFEIKRLLKAAIEHENLVSSTAIPPISRQSIRPTLADKDEFQDRQALELGTPAGLVMPSRSGLKLQQAHSSPENSVSTNPVASADKDAEAQPRLQTPETLVTRATPEPALVRANEVVPSAQEFSLPPTANVVDKSRQMLDHLMDALAAQDQQPT